MHDIICHFYDLQSYCQWPLTKECTRISAVIVKNIEVQGELYNYKECVTVVT